MHINHRRKNKHTCYRYKNYGWRDHCRRKPVWDMARVMFNKHGWFQSRGVRIYFCEETRMRQHVKQMLFLGEYDNIMTWLPGRWDWDD